MRGNAAVIVDGAFHVFIRGNTLTLFGIGSSMDVYYKSDPTTGGTWTFKLVWPPVGGESEAQMLSPDGRIVVYVVGDR